MPGVISRLYRGDINIDFVGKRKIWYGLSVFLLAVSILGLALNGLNLGVEFRGGSVFDFKRTPGSSIEQVRDTVTDAGVHQVIVQQAGPNWRVTTEALKGEEVTKVQRTVAQKYGVTEDEVSSQVIGATWGGEVSQKAWIGLAVFMIAIMLYLSVAFEWRMALAAIVALVHDLVITAGVYAWSGFEVTPATMLGFLTILGYSLYDAVVVFDMIKEVTGKLGTSAKMTYTQAANNALSHTLIRSLNTSLVAILPVAAILFIGTTLLGAGTLKDLSLALFVGMIVGTYSSLCVATPILVTLKEREPKWQALAQRVHAKEVSAAKAGRATKEPVSAGSQNVTVAEKRKKR
ncbi:protein translocase subunit SecF [Microbispora bryophytorum]|uniref:Protein-export membrane protein SecF n=1 Tax=Microbispora bryophytorum TaxID=1460882 RepID=A0A8H9LBQ8_9ACTN|nr:protein translocase subunit SecF [Microbispora bryophytorum]MBD3140620.1 protein translocase subunit SecF [Microbispora bryophytorum]TQS01908.1 protein translocase subunit SecF [Microbispora bryophytorum]GGO14892.1 protein translocase subunit SecF [Microbispora bryophytorum]